jgi:hypothetical protein
MSDVSTDPDNELAEVARNLGATPAVVHIDRHVLDVCDYVRTADTQEAACRKAIELANRWSNQRQELVAAEFLVSEPVVIIDDDWIGVPREADPTDGTPPHVYICIANDSSVFEPVRAELLATHTRTGSRYVDVLLTPDMTLHRVDSDDPELSGCWLLQRSSTQSSR